MTNQQHSIRWHSSVGLRGAQLVTICNANDYAQGNGTDNLDDAGSCELESDVSGVVRPASEKNMPNDDIVEDTIAARTIECALEPN